jgi:hypothetical protein
MKMPYFIYTKKPTCTFNIGGVKRTDFYEIVFELGVCHKVNGKDGDAMA